MLLSQISIDKVSYWTVRGTASCLAHYPLHCSTTVSSVNTVTVMATAASLISDSAQDKQSANTLTATVTVTDISLISDSAVTHCADTCARWSNHQPIPTIRWPTYRRVAHFLWKASAARNPTVRQRKNLHPPRRTQPRHMLLSLNMQMRTMYSMIFLHARMGGNTARVCPQESRKMAPTHPAKASAVVTAAETAGINTGDEMNTAIRKMGSCA